MWRVLPPMGRKTRQGRWRSEGCVGLPWAGGYSGADRGRRDAGGAWTRRRGGGAGLGPQPALAAGAATRSGADRPATASRPQLSPRLDRLRRPARPPAACAMAALRRPLRPPRGDRLQLPPDHPRPARRPPPPRARPDPPPPLLHLLDHHLFEPLLQRL